jgi:hypothetical protein
MESELLASSSILMVLVLMVSGRVKVSKCDGVV